MKMTLLLSAVMMAGLFLMLYAAVALIQDKKFFTSAPKEIQAAVLPKPERFPCAHLMGWCLEVLALALMGGALVLGAWDGILADFGFWQLFGRFFVMLLLLKAFDVLFFDWVLLCHSGFFPRFYPEVKDIVGPHLFGYNRKEHLVHVAFFLPASAVMAFAALWIGGRL